MDKYIAFPIITDEQIIWEISIFRNQTVLDKALYYSQRIVDRIGCVENLSCCESDLSFSNCIVTFEKRCKYSELKDIVKVMMCMVESPFEIMCFANDSKREHIIGISSSNQVWGVTISRSDYATNTFKNFFDHCKEFVLVHADELYLNFAFKSSYFEVLNINPFSLFLITPYPSYNECFPWKDTGVRYTIKYIPHETLWDTSGDDLSILPEMW